MSEQHAHDPDPRREGHAGSSGHPHADPSNSHDHDHPAHDHPAHDHQAHDHQAHDHQAHDHQAHDHGGHEGGLRGLIAGVFSGHSHDATDSVDHALTASTEGMRALKVSFAVLAATAMAQFLVVAISGSVALLGDSIHNFADTLTAVPLGIAFLLGRRPPTKRYTYGYGRAEDLAGVFVVAMIALSSAIAAWEAIQRLMHPRPLHNLAWVMMAGVVGFAGNELVAVYRIRVGRRIGSAALVADGLHARTDGLTSLAVVAGALGVALGWRLADPIVGLLITAAILVVLRGAARDMYRRLMDSVDPMLVEEVHGVLVSVSGVDSVDQVRIRWVGHELFAEAEITSDGDLSLADAHAIAEEAHHRLLHDIPRLAQATIHTNPCAHDGRDHHTLTAHHFPDRSGAHSPSP